MGDQPLISIIMPTLNSASTLRIALQSIACQSIDKALVEVLVIDGGSVDETRTIADEFGSSWLENARVQPEFAKLVGLESARGRYAMFLDSDEELCDLKALEKKLALFERFPRVKNIITAGLRNPPNFPDINDYVNRFGEPFSYFMYRIDGGDYTNSLRDRYGVAHDDGESLVVQFSDDDVAPICDGGGHCFDLDYLKSIVGEVTAETVPAVFALMVVRTRCLGVIPGDFTMHYSTTSARRYLNKIRWRIISNVHRTTGVEGFATRDSLQPTWFRRKKYLFLPYALLLVPAFLDAAMLTIKYRKLIFLLHFPVAVYTALVIAQQFLLKALGFTTRLPEYGR